jgi:YegS/Rv2252/BmrU family lipid kinase
VRARLVVNPQSRRGREIGDEARAALRRLGVKVVDRPEADADAIVVVGGDGTIAGEIPHALQFGVPLGIVPAGTFNDLARSLGLPHDVQSACDAIAGGRTRAIDVAQVNGAYYATEASIGISSRLARLQKASDKRRFGALAIVASALQALRYARTFHAEIAYDGKRLRFKTLQLTVANSEHFGGLVTVEGASIDDGWLDLYSVEIESLGQMASVTAAIVTGRPRHTRGLRSYRARAFDVFTHRPHRITADGEPAGTTPARFSLVPQAVRVFVPKT